MRLNETKRKQRTSQEEVLAELFAEADLEKNWFEIEVHCSKGTYIRSLCDDIGEKLGCLAGPGRGATE